MNAQEALKRLQDTDLRREALRAEIETAKASMDKATAGLPKVEALVERARVGLQQAKKAVHLQEVEVGELRDKRKALEPKLNRATSVKAAEAVQHEMQLLDEKIGALEDKLLELMEAEEDAADTLEKAEEGMKTARARVEAGRSALPEKISALEEQIQSADVDRQRWTGYLEDDVLSRYEALRERLRGRVVVEADASCEGCDFSFTEGQQMELLRRKAEIQTCPECRRLLIFTGVDRL